MINCDTNESGNEGCPVYSGPTPDQSYALNVEPSMSHGLPHYVVTLNGTPVACSLDMLGGNLTAMQIEDQLGGF